MKLKLAVFAVCLLPLVSACFAKPFQPPTADVDLWQKAGQGNSEVRQAMAACGYANDPGAPLEKRAERFECMKRAGYTRSDGFDLCTQGTDRPLKACEAAH